MKGTVFETTRFWHILYPVGYGASSRPGPHRATAQLGASGSFRLSRSASQRRLKALAGALT